MAFDANSIRLGAARLLVDGNDIGFTSGGASLAIKTTTNRVEIDHFGPVQTREIVTKREVTLTVNLSETNIGTLYLALGNAAGTQSINGTIALTLPQGPGLALHALGRVVDLHPIDRADSDYAENLRLPCACWDGNLTYAYTVDNERRFTLAFLGYPDATGKTLYMGLPLTLPQPVSAPTQIDPNTYIVTPAGNPITLGGGGSLTS